MFSKDRAMRLLSILAEEKWLNCMQLMWLRHVVMRRCTEWCLQYCRVKCKMANVAHGYS